MNTSNFLDLMQGLDWERGLQVGDAVDVCWGHGQGFRASGAGVIAKINAKSFQVRLTEDVVHRGKVGWRAGHVLKGILRRTSWQRWDLWNTVHPPKDGRELK